MVLRRVEIFKVTSSAVRLAVVLFLLSACTTTVATESPLSTVTPASFIAVTIRPTREPVITPADSALPTSVPPTEPPIIPPTEPLFLTHVIQPGDTLLAVAQVYGVPIAAIQLQNRMGESTVLHAGESLVIPPVLGWEEASLFWILHVVKPGETLARIGQMYGLDVERLQEVNDLADIDHIAVGQELIMPVEVFTVAVLPTPTPTATVPPSPTPVLPTALPPTAVRVPPPPPPSDVAAWPQEVARLINAMRAAYGLPPMVYNETLARSAQGHANDCSQRGWCSHTGSDGSDAKTRILRAGYPATGWAECWVQNQTPQAGMDWWMNSDIHRRTILSTWVTEMGIGVAQAEWGYYFVVNFGRP